MGETVSGTAPDLNLLFCPDPKYIYFLSVRCIDFTKDVQSNLLMAFNYAVKNVLNLCNPRDFNI